MRLFLRVADAGSFSRAAADLELGQPTVSRRIQDLEESLGTTLFQRTTRALSLTEAGTRFYKRATDILTGYDEAEAEARGLENAPVGLLRISCSHSFARRVSAPAATSFLAAWPSIRVDLLSEDAITDLVAEGVDIAFRRGELRDEGLEMLLHAAVERRRFGTTVAVDGERTCIGRRQCRTPVASSVAGIAKAPTRAMPALRCAWSALRATSRTRLAKAAARHAPPASTMVFKVSAMRLIEGAENARAYDCDSRTR